jgi:hypothetical protein
MSILVALRTTQWITRNDRMRAVAPDDKGTLGGLTVPRGVRVTGLKQDVDGIDHL